MSATASQKTTRLPPLETATQESEETRRDPERREVCVFPESEDSDDGRAANDVWPR